MKIHSQTPRNENRSDVRLFGATLDARRKWSSGFNVLKTIYFPPILFQMII